MDQISDGFNVFNLFLIDRPDVPQKPKVPPKVPPKPFLLTRGHDSITSQVSPSPSSVSQVPRMCPEPVVMGPPPARVGGTDNCNNG